MDAVSSRKFLEAAMNTDDAMLFYTVFKFFEQRNAKIRGNPKFQPGTIIYTKLLTLILIIETILRIECNSVHKFFYQYIFEDSRF